MHALLSYLSSFKRITRYAAIGIIYVVGIVVALSLLAHAGTVANPMPWFWAVVAIPFFVSLLATPIGVSIENEFWEAKGIYGMYVTEPVTRR